MPELQVQLSLQTLDRRPHAYGSGAGAVDNPFGEPPLVESPVLVARGDGDLTGAAFGLAQRTMCEADDRGRVESAGQARAHGHVRAQPQANAVVEELAKLRGGSVGRSGERARGEIVPANHLDA